MLTCVCLFLQSYQLYSIPSRTLQHLQLPLVDIEVCAKNPNYPGLNTSLLLCAGKKGKILVKPSFWLPDSTLWRVRFQFQIGIFLIKTQHITLCSGLGYQIQPWFGPPGSENASVFHMGKLNVATSLYCHILRFPDIFAYM